MDYIELRLDPETVEYFKKVFGKKYKRAMQSVVTVQAHQDLLAFWASKQAQRDQESREGRTNDVNPNE